MACRVILTKRNTFLERADIDEDTRRDLVVGVTVSLSTGLSASKEKKGARTGGFGVAGGQGSHRCLAVI